MTSGVLIDVYIDTTDVAVTIATAGAFSIVVQIPAAAIPGNHFVTAVVRTSGIGSQKAFLVQTNWAQQGFTAKGKRSNPYENVLSPSNVGLIDLDWSFTTGGTIINFPPVTSPAG